MNFAKNMKAGRENMRLECLLGEVEERLTEEFFDELPVEEEENEYVIVANEARIIVPALNLSVREGTYLRYDEDEEDYLADFSLTLIYEKDETDPKKYLCWEQDDLIVAIYNYINRSANYDMDALEACSCIAEWTE